MEEAETNFYFWFGRIATINIKLKLYLTNLTNIHILSRHFCFVGITKQATKPPTPLSPYGPFLPYRPSWVHLPSWASTRLGISGPEEYNPLETLKL